MIYTNGLNVVQSLIAQGKVDFWAGLIVPHAIAAVVTFLLFRQRMAPPGGWLPRPRAA
jgi:lipopolysaccharide export LptBFGC system permease protein LptF